MYNDAVSLTVYVISTVDDVGLMNGCVSTGSVTKPFTLLANLLSHISLYALLHHWTILFLNLMTIINSVIN